jgi:putative SOS response-associated peptidase YedK
MCGRIATAFEWKDVEDEFNPEVVRAQFSSRFNVAPTQNIPVILFGSTAYDEFKWGFVPHWAKKDPKPVINARAEGIEEKPYFRTAFKKNRCLVLVSGFYEWDKSKTPYYFTLKKKKVYALAGIFDYSKSDDKPTVAIITTEANEALEGIHHRMPVIMEKKNYSKWIDPNFENQEELLQMLRPFDASKILKKTVSKTVNSPKNDVPDVLKGSETQATL